MCQKQHVVIKQLSLMSKTMNNASSTFGKKTVTAFSLAMLCISVSTGFLNTAYAQVFRGNEREPLQSDMPATLCDNADNQSASDIAVNDNRKWAMVWEDDACEGGANGSGIYYQSYDVINGVDSTSGPTHVNTTTTGDQNNPAIAMDHEGNMVIAWEGNGSGDSDGIFVRAYKNDGTPVSAEQIVNTYTTGVQSHPKIAMDFDTSPSLAEVGHFVVTWEGEGTGDSNGVYMQRFDVDFDAGITTVGTNTLVNTYTTGNQKGSDVAMNNFGEALVTWSGPGTGYTTVGQVWAQAYDAANSPMGSNLRINSTANAVRPSVASDKSTEPGTASVPGGKFVIVYEYVSPTLASEIDAKLLDRCTVSGCQTSNVELNINGTGSTPDVAMDYLGNFTVTWEQDDTAEGQYINIHAVNYNYLGQRVDNAFRVNENVFSDGSQNQTLSRVAKDKDGEYFVTWTTPTFSLDNDVRYRMFETDIFKNGTETITHVPTLIGYNEGVPSVAVAPNGNHVAVFLGEDTNSGETRVKFSLYDRDNNVIVQEQIADTFDNSTVFFPSVSFFKDSTGSGLGRFVIAWSGTDPLSSENGVFYREFDQSGNPLTPNELIANSSNPGYTYAATAVKAGYYNDATSSVVDRFAIFYNLADTANQLGGNEAAYHTNTGFTYATVEAISADCYYNCLGLNLDMYADIGGNDKIVYTWTQSDADQWGVYGREANAGTLSGTRFSINSTTTFQQGFSDVAFVSPTEYVTTWSTCTEIDCTIPHIMGKRYTGSFTGSAPTVTDADFTVYPGGGQDVASNGYSRIAADPATGDFLIVWEKTYADAGVREIYGKYFESAAGLSNYGVGFIINSSVNSGASTPTVAMNNNGKSMVGWSGSYYPFGLNIDDNASMYQMLNNPMFVEGTPELPTTAQLTIAEGGKTLTIPSNIQFPSAIASTTMTTDVTRQIDENPAVGQPLFFQVDDLGGNSSNCVPGPCYSVTISSTDFTYTDSITGQTYTIPASNIFIKNYDGNHAGVFESGSCGSVEAQHSFESIFGEPTDFALDGSSCDFTSLDTNKTLLNKVTNISDTARIRFYPEIKITIDPLTPPGTYTGTITITSV